MERKTSGQDHEERLDYIINAARNLGDFPPRPHGLNERVYALMKRLFYAAKDFLPADSKQKIYVGDIFDSMRLVSLHYGMLWEKLNAWKDCPCPQVQTVYEFIKSAKVSFVVKYDWRIYDHDEQSGYINRRNNHSTEQSKLF